MALARGLLAFGERKGAPSSGAPAGTCDAGVAFPNTVRYVSGHAHEYSLGRSLSEGCKHSLSRVIALEHGDKSFRKHVLFDVNFIQFYVFSFLTVTKVQDLVEVCDADQQEWSGYQHYLTTITSIDLQAIL